LPVPGGHLRSLLASPPMEAAIALVTTDTCERQLPGDGAQIDQVVRLATEEPHPALHDRAGIIAFGSQTLM
jgi:hypothetical protein